MRNYDAIQNNNVLKLDQLSPNLILQLNSKNRGPWLKMIIFLIVLFQQERHRDSANRYFLIGSYNNFHKGKLSSELKDDLLDLGDSDSGEDNLGSLYVCHLCYQVGNWGIEKIYSLQLSLDGNYKSIINTLHLKLYLQIGDDLKRLYLVYRVKRKPISNLSSQKLKMIENYISLKFRYLLFLMLSICTWKRIIPTKDLDMAGRIFSP